MKSGPFFGWLPLPLMFWSSNLVELFGGQLRRSDGWYWWAGLTSLKTHFNNFVVICTVLLGIWSVLAELWRVLWCAWLILCVAFPVCEWYFWFCSFQYLLICDQALSVFWLSAPQTRSTTALIDFAWWAIFLFWRRGPLIRLHWLLKYLRTTLQPSWLSAGGFLLGRTMGG